MHEPTIIQRALLTVYDKSNILELAENLHLRGVELISTGNTAALLQKHGLPVTPVSEYTGFPEMMDGRVKTLHPKIHGGILGRRDIDGDTMLAHGIPDIDLVVVNLYPFQQVMSDPNASLEDIIENIDVGGPTLIRGAAKNYQWCTVLVDANDYQSFITELQKNNGAICEKSRFRYATKAFAHTAHYDATIANFFSRTDEQTTHRFGETLSLHYQLKERLRYGENPHQEGAFYQELFPPKDSITATTQLQGKELSYNNIADADCALECVKNFDECACVIVKHANPCAVAIAENAKIAYDKAYSCDPTSAFGGIIAFNQEVDDKLIQHILSQQFVEVIIAPHYTLDALEIAEQKQNCRVLQYHPTPLGSQFQRNEIKSVNGGILVQSMMKSTPKFEIVTKRAPTKNEMQDLIFSWNVVNFVKSNGIVFAKDGQTLGIGAGQMSRIFSTEIAALKAKMVSLELKGAVMASDAFFPFKDNVEKAHMLGLSAIIQPGGSKRDLEVIECANAFDIAMIFTGIRCFRH